MANSAVEDSDESFYAVEDIDENCSSLLSVKTLFEIANNPDSDKPAFAAEVEVDDPKKCGESFDTEKKWASARMQFGKRHGDNYARKNRPGGAG